jgi:hypothetical protein
MLQIFSIIVDSAGTHARMNRASQRSQKGENLLHLVYLLGALVRQGDVLESRDGGGDTRPGNQAHTARRRHESLESRHTQERAHRHQVLGLAWYRSSSRR